MSVGASDGGKQPYRFKISVFGAQKKAIAFVVRGLLEEMLKDHVGVSQLANIVVPHAEMTLHIEIRKKAIG